MRRRATAPPVAAGDRHADRVAALRTAVFDSDALADGARRAVAASPGADVGSLLGSYLTRVREASYRITDEDIAALGTAGHGEEEIFELTVAAALGAAMVSLNAGLGALRSDA